MAEHPAGYPWSSYCANAQGEPSALLQPHALYTALGRAGDERRTAYRELFRYQLDPGIVDQIRAATNGNYALGSPVFQAQIAQALGRRVTPGKSGQPPKSAEPGSLSLPWGE